jgi:uncharacterized protein (TIGR03083 family)
VKTAHHHGALYDDRVPDAPSQAGSTPILTAHLLPVVEARLVELLRSLGPSDWERPTIVPAWKVRHVAAHLLDTSLRKISVVRDKYFGTGPKSSSPADVSAFVNQANADGVRVYGSLSPPVLISLIDSASRQLCDLTLSLDPLAQATFAVSWAGESESQNWFDTARELTERWHHQQQIRLAVGREGIMTPELYHPVLETFMRALPFAYRETAAPVGTQLRIVITGDCGGEWILARRDAWQFSPHAKGREAAARIEVPQAIAWRIFTKGIAPDEAKAQSVIEGDSTLTDHFFHTRAIVT